MGKEEGKLPKNLKKGKANIVSYFLSNLVFLGIGHSLKVRLACERENQNSNNSEIYFKK